MRQRRLWKSLTIAFLVSLTIILVFSPNSQVISKSVSSEIKTELNSNLDLDKSFEVAQIFQLFDANRYQVLAKADQFYEQGNLRMARSLQRQVKPDFAQPAPIPQPILKADDIDKIDPAAKVYWRIANEGIRDNLESKIIQPLQLLSENYPQFIPGQLLYVQQLVKYDRTEEAIEILENTRSLYPNVTTSLDTQINLLGEERRWLEASIAARQFAITNPEHPEAPKYQNLAMENEKKFRSQIQQDLISKGIIIAALRGREGVSRMSILLDGEAKAGEMLAQQYKTQLTLVEDETMVNYVNQVGQNIAKLMGRDDFNYEFFIVEDPNINAFAFPGGKIFVNTGILEQMNSEAELAGLLGHEVAHSVLSHSFKKMVNRESLDILTEVTPMANIANQFILADTSRSFERQADELATRVISTAGYSADGVHSMMNIIKQISGNSSTKTPWLATHPVPAKRVKYLEDLIERNGYNRYAKEGVIEYQTAVKGISSPEALVDSIPQDRSSPPSNEPITGKVEIALLQKKSDVEIRLHDANVEEDRSFTLSLSIVNNSERKVKIIPERVLIYRGDGSRILSEFNFDDNTGEDVIQPNSTRTGKIYVPSGIGVGWENSEAQGLTLEVTETLGRARVFRIEF